MANISSISYSKDFESSALSRSKNLEKSQLLLAQARQENLSYFKEDNSSYIIRSLMPNEIKTLMNECHCTYLENINDDSNGGDDNKWFKNVKLMYYPYDDSTKNGDNLSCFLKQQISHCKFSGTIILGISTRENTKNNMNHNQHPILSSLPYGIHNVQLIHDSILEPDCRVYNTFLIKNTHVFSFASIVNCGSILVDNKFSSKMKISVGPESGNQERFLECFPESTLPQITQTLYPPFQIKISDNDNSQTDKGLISLYKQSSDKMLSSTTLYNVLSPHSYISNNHNTITNIYLSSKSFISDSCNVQNCILLEDSYIKNNSTVSNTFLQWNSHIQNQAISSDTLIMEQSSVGDFAKVSSSILGPDVHLEGGETHHSLLGPNINSHHQSLLISVIWPQGRGNVGYGSNIGSNHSGRKPDLEAWPSEGLFFGLSCAITFPLNLMKSPYSLIGAGGTSVGGSQEISMPFSLIIGKGDILPGWVYKYSPYTIERNQDKFKKRRKATRHMYYTDYNIFRPHVIELCRRARNALLLFENNKESGDTKKLLRLRQSMIGNCNLSEKARKNGIRFYSHCIQRYTLLGLLKKLLLSAIEKQKGGSASVVLSALAFLSSSQIAGSLHNSNQIPDELQGVCHDYLPWQEPSFLNPTTFEWKYQQFLMVSEFPSLFDTPKSTTKDALPSTKKSLFYKNISYLLSIKLLQLEKEYSMDVLRSKQKDDERIQSIFSSTSEKGHKHNNMSGTNDIFNEEDDSVIKLARQHYEQIEKDVQYVVQHVLRIKTDQEKKHSRL